MRRRSALPLAGILLALLALETSALLVYLALTRGPLGGCACPAQVQPVAPLGDDGPPDPAFVECGLTLEPDGPPPARPTGVVTVEQAEVARGGSITVRVIASAGLPDDAWVGIVPSHVPHGDEAVNDRFDVAYEYLGGRTEAVLTLPAPEVPGAYDVRLNSTDANGEELSSASFSVRRPLVHHCITRR